MNQELVVTSILGVGFGAEETMPKLPRQMKRTLQGVTSSLKIPPQQSTSVALCLGTYSEPMEMGVSFERGTPVVVVKTEYESEGLLLASNYPNTSADLEVSYGPIFLVKGLSHVHHPTRFLLEKVAGLALICEKIEPGGSPVPQPCHRPRDGRNTNLYIHVYIYIYIYIYIYTCIYIALCINKDTYIHIYIKKNVYI